MVKLRPQVSRCLSRCGGLRKLADRAGFDHSERHELARKEGELIASIVIPGIVVLIVVIVLVVFLLRRV